MTKKANKFKWFLFPLAPYRIFKSTKLMLIIAVLFALRIILGFVHISIPNINISISFAWIPIMVAGWIFGPVHGLIFGFVCDSFTFLISPTSVWFWMYAIQEPLIGMISGITRSWYEFRKQKSKNIIYDILIQQIVLFAFASTSLCGILLWVNDNVLDYFNSYKYICIGLICAFLIAIEIFTFINFSKNREDKNKSSLFLYSVALVSIIMISFSFLLGPIAAVEYLKYINGSYPEMYMRYGLLIYLIPRIIVQSIKVPFESLIFCSTILVINPILNNYFNALENKW